MRIIDGSYRGWRLVLTVFVLLSLPLFAAADGGGGSTEDGHSEAGAKTTIHGLVTLLHIVSAVFMAWPLYALISVNERGMVDSPLGGEVDTYMENILKKQGGRCYVFQLTVFLTGLYLWARGDYGLTLSPSNVLMLGKLMGLFLMTGLLSYVIFILQPKIDGLFMQLKNTKDDAVVGKLNSLRLKRKKLASVCLSVLLAVLVFAVQIHTPFSLTVNTILLALAAFFSYRVFKMNTPYGWV